MHARSAFGHLLLVCGLILLTELIGYGECGSRLVVAGDPVFSSEPEPANDLKTVALGATVIHPFRTANIGSEVGGIIEEFRFRESEKITEGSVVVQVSQKRYAILAESAQARLDALERSFGQAQEELKVKKAVYEQEAATVQQVLRAESEAEAIKVKIVEATKELELARLNLQASDIKAPFTGFLAVKYKQAHEPAERLEKMFLLVDAAKVYAVANIPEDSLSDFRVGGPAQFVHSDGQRYLGTVEWIGTLIDPKSGTTKVQVLIDNAAGRLRIGTTGRLEAVR
jgi:RND family efflux transporter MFP subunit